MTALATLDDLKRNGIEVTDEQTALSLLDSVSEARPLGRRVSDHARRMDGGPARRTVQETRPAMPSGARRVQGTRGRAVHR